MSGVRQETVTKDEDGLRLDRWFRRRYPALGHGRLEKLLRTGQVRIDGGRAKSNARLSAGQTVRVPPLPADTGEPPRKPVSRDVKPEDAEMLMQRLLHQDDDVLAIDKPAGLAVQGGSGTHRHIDGMLDALRLGAKERPRLVHRLDRDTSGVLLLARSAKAAAALSRAFQARDTDKRYLAIVAGLPRPERGHIDAALAKRGGAQGERMQWDDDAGQRARTDYAVLDRAARTAALVELRPLTGRTHQLRAHCQILGTPILGDGKYGGAEAFIDGVPGGKRVHLHARRLDIAHPRHGRLIVEAPLPDDFRNTMRFLGLTVPPGREDPFED